MGLGDQFKVTLGDTGLGHGVGLREPAWWNETRRVGDRHGGMRPLG